MASKKNEIDDAGPRRYRLEVLKARRQLLVEPSVEHSYSMPQAVSRDWAWSDAVPPQVKAVPVPIRVPVAAAPAPAIGGAMAKLMGGDQQGGKALRAQMLAKAMQLLTKTPQDADGMVAGTPFTSAGLTKLMQMLRDRAATPDAPGSKAVRTALAFLQAAPGEASTRQGLSVSKLQMVAQRVAGTGQGAASMSTGAKVAPHGGAVNSGAVKSAAINSGAMKTGLDGASAKQREVMGKLHHMLTNTPIDARGLVAGTSFSAAGVSRLMTLLRQRATQPGTPAGKMAAKMVDSLAATADEVDVIDGASLAKFRSLAARLAGAS